MSSNLVPGVRLTESTERLSVPQSNQVVLGIIGTSEKGTPNIVTSIYSVAEAESTFGSKTAYGANLVSMIKRAFQEGASLIKAVSIGTPDLDVTTAGTQGALTADSLAGATILTVATASLYTAGDIVYVGPDTTYAKAEKLVVVSGIGTTVTVSTPLEFNHYIGENLKIVTEKEDADYTDAISAMEADIDKNLVVCESNTVGTLSAMNTMAINSTFNYNTPCVFVGSALSTDTEATVIVKAKALNSERAIIAYPLLMDFSGKIVTSGENAAATAGVIAGQGLPKLNLNGSKLTGFQGVAKAITNNDLLISGGVSPIEVKYGSLHFIKIVTTKSSTNGIPDSTWREASVRLNVDVIEKTILSNIQLIYMQKGNTPEVRQSIKQKVISMLEVFARQSIIVPDEVTKTPAYRTPVVYTDSEDSTKVNIDIEISPAKPLNFIQLNFKVSI